MGGEWGDGGKEPLRFLRLRLNEPSVEHKKRPGPH